MSFNKRNLIKNLLCANYIQEKTVNFFKKVQFLLKIPLNQSIIARSSQISIFFVLQQNNRKYIQYQLMYAMR